MGYHSTNTVLNDTNQPSMATLKSICSSHPSPKFPFSRLHKYRRNWPCSSRTSSGDLYSTIVFVVSILSLSHMSKASSLSASSISTIVEQAFSGYTSSLLEYSRMCLLRYKTLKAFFKSVVDLLDVSRKQAKVFFESHPCGSFTPVALLTLVALSPEQAGNWDNNGALCNQQPSWGELGHTHI